MTTPAATVPTPVERISGKVKKVNSGDTIIVWTRGATGAPQDMVVHLANINSPKCAVYTPDQNQKDEPLGFEAREYLRKELIGNEVCCEVEHRTAKAVFGFVFKGTSNEGENMVESVVAKGYASVKEVGKKNERYDKLKEIQEIAKTNKAGIWADDKASKVRQIVWAVDDAAAFVEKNKKKPLKAIVESVHPSACGVRALVPIDEVYNYVTVMLSGIRGPSDESQLRPRAIYFLEVGVLQSDVEITLTGAGNNGQMFGQLKHPRYDVVKGLVENGLAQTSDWSLASMDPSYATTLRQAEQSAKERKLCIWKDYKAPVRPAAVANGGGSSVAKVVEIVSADCLVVKESGGNYKKIFLSSIRPPRREQANSDVRMTMAKRMFEQPLLFDAREHLRLKLIGKQVNLAVDYIQPKSEQFPEKVCCTVTIGGTNVAQELVSKGLASVIKYRQDNDQRSSHYLDLQAAEGEAQKNAVGLYAKKDAGPMRVADLQGDLVKSKQYFTSLQRSNPNEGIVEFISSGSRVRVYCAKHNALFPLLFNGISCPRAGRPELNNQPAQAGDPFGDEALQFTKDACLQHQIEIEIESQDKNGAMIGWAFIDKKNMSIELVKAGYATVHHFSAEKSRYYRELCAAEEAAKLKQLRVWKNYVEPKKDDVVEEAPEDTKTDRKVELKSVMVSEVTETVTKFYVQFNDDGPKLEELQASLQKEMTAHPPMAGAYTPKRGDRCAAKFADGNWYRAKVDKINSGKAEVVYVDYGNREISEFSKLASLPGAFSNLGEYAHPCNLAFVKVPKDEEELAISKKAFQADVDNAVLKMNLEYKFNGENYVTLHTSDGKTDIGKGLIADGLVYFDERKGDRYRKICGEYDKAQQEAKKERKNLWLYGDSREDDNERN